MSGPKYTPKYLVFSDVSFIAICAEVSENECIIERHLRIIDASLFASGHVACLIGTVRCRFDRNGPISSITIRLWSVRPSVCHNRDARLTGSTYRNAFCTIR